MTLAPDLPRWCSSGSSTAAHGRQAASAAARDALDSAGTGAAAGDVVLAVVFASSAFDLADVAAGLRDVLPLPTVLAGCTTSGEIAGTASTSAALVVMLFGGTGFRATAAASTGLAQDSAAAGESVAQQLYAAVGTGGPDAPDEPDAATTHPHDVVLLLSDGLSGDQQALVTGVYRVTGAAVPLVGGCAGDDLAMQRTHQLIGDHDGDRVLHDAVVGVLLRSAGAVGIGVHHGWQRVGEPMVATDVDGVQVLTLDDEPAMDAYLRAMGAPPELGEDVGAFTGHALTHPLGIAAKGQDVARFVTGADLSTRAMTLLAPVPRGGLVWVLRGDVSSVLDATETACRSAMAQLHGNPVRGVVAFDCAARRAVLGESTQDEVDRISAVTGGAPAIGFYTYGEIARTRGMNAYHNQTLVVLAVA